MMKDRDASTAPATAIAPAGQGMALRPFSPHAQAGGLDAVPRVSIGMPVYNGAAYLPRAIEGILSQTFTDFELVICDNASTDQTQSICTAFAARDPRVRYHRNKQNIGAAGNFNLAFRLSRGKYFKWAAHDDLHGPEYLACCVDLLEHNPSAVLSHARAVVVDAEGREVPVQDGESAAEGNASQYRREHLYDPARAMNSDDPALRLSELLTRTKWCFEIFGLMRSDALRRTPLHLLFYGSDKVLLAAMALQGPFIEAPEALFFRRHHAGQSSSKTGREQAKWMSMHGRPQYVPPQIRCFQWHVRLIARSGLPLRDRLRCLGAVAQGVGWLVRLIISQRNERGFLHRLVARLRGHNHS